MSFTHYPGMFQAERLILRVPIILIYIEYLECFFDMITTETVLLPVTPVYYILSVIGMAYGKTLESLIYVGQVGIMDPPREEVCASIMTLKGMQVTVKMLTGDGEGTAKAVGEPKKAVRLWGRFNPFSSCVRYLLNKPVLDSKLAIVFLDKQLNANILLLICKQS